MKQRALFLLMAIVCQARAGVREEVEAAGHKWGSRVLIRTYKSGEDIEKIPSSVKSKDTLFHRFRPVGQTEVWLQDQASGQYKLFKTYPIGYFSGKFGPKLKRGDYQSPEGVYKVSILEPNSNYHKALDVGYPNALDRSLGRTGSLIRLHGELDGKYYVSVGCLSLENEYIDEIYAIADAARNAKNGMPDVHMFPFRMEKLEEVKADPFFKDDPYYKSLFSGWEDLKAVDDEFKRTQRLPIVDAVKGRYVVRKQEVLVDESKLSPH